MTDNPWHQPGRWQVSPWNYLPEAIGERPPMRGDFIVADSTIRSICTSEPGSVATVDGLVEIARMLDEVGVRQIQFNVAHTGSISSMASAAARAVVRAGLRPTLGGGTSLLPGDWRSNLDASIDCGLEQLEISYGAMEQPGWNETPAVFETAEAACEYVLSQRKVLTVAYNVRRHTSLDYFVEYFRRLLKYKPWFARLYDPTTCLNPQAMSILVRALRQELGADCPPIVIHTHQPWGLATAVNIYAVHAGAAGIDIAVNAIGTKSGHTPFAEVILALEALYGVCTGIQLDKLYALSKLVERVVGLKIHPHNPITGTHAFIAEQGPAVAAALREEITGEPALTPFSAQVVGRTRTIVWGRNSLKPHVVKLKLQAMGLPAGEDEAERTMSALGERITAQTTYPAWLEDDQAEEVVRATLAS